MTYEQALKINWVLDGQTVRGYYCGILVEGTVQSSRVKYGTDQQYHVKLQAPTQILSSIREEVLLDGIDITEVL